MGVDIVHSQSMKITVYNVPVNIQIKVQHLSFTGLNINGTDVKQYNSLHNNNKSLNYGKTLEMNFMNTKRCTDRKQYPTL